MEKPKIKLNGNKYHDAISKTFLLEYEGAKSVNIPQGYTFPKGKPNLMQQLVAYKVKTNRLFGNFSKTGTGKTLSAVLASRVVDSHMTVIICPNAVVK
jgi:superfamily II DNA or RNA helicase